MKTTKEMLEQAGKEWAKAISLGNRTMENYWKREHARLLKTIQKGGAQ